MNTIPRSKFRSFHVRCSISPFRIPVSRIVENSRRSSSRQAAKNFRISSDVMNRGSDRFGTRFRAQVALSMNANAYRPGFHVALSDDEHGVNFHFLGAENFAVNLIGTEVDLGSNII